MNEWFREAWENETGRNRFYSSPVYNPATGELYLFSLFGLVSMGLAVYNFMGFMQNHETFVSALIGIFPLGLGIAGLIMSFKYLPYAFSYKSLYRISACMAGILFSLMGILCTILLYVVMFVPEEVLVQFVG